MKSSRLVPPQASVIHALHAQSGSLTNKSPRKHPNTKRTGELAEAAFVVKAAGLGFAVSKPWGDSERYDFILDSGPRTWRVQIKCTESLNANGYPVQSTYCDRKQKGHYTAADIDVLVAYILPLDLWYVVPAHAFPASASLRFYPEGNISGRQPRFEQYREAWRLFQQSQPSVDHHPSSNCHPERSEGPAVPASEQTGASLGDCHPERSDSRATRGSHEVEEPALSLPKGPLPPPELPAAPPAPESPMERTMSQWAQRVNSLYHRKR